MPIRKSKKDRQHNGQKKRTKGQRRSIKHYTKNYKDRVTRTPLKPRGNSGAPEE